MQLLPVLSGIAAVLVIALIVGVALYGFWPVVDHRPRRVYDRARSEQDGRDYERAYQRWQREGNDPKTEPRPPATPDPLTFRDL